jgi:hypothetical protein
MVHRHLYTHRSGLVDDEYISNLHAVTGLDITSELTALGYPTDEVYFFRPLSELPRFIEAARKFFAALP